MNIHTPAATAMLMPSRAQGRLTQARSPERARTRPRPRRAWSYPRHCRRLTPVQRPGTLGRQMVLIALFITAVLQLVVVILSHSVALFAATIHNFGDAATGFPLAVAFAFAKRRPTRRFPFGYGRVEDLAGMAVVLTIFASAVVAGYQAINRLLHPQLVTHLGAIVAASIIGFLGNELVAIFRIRVGKEIGSAALIADGYHARTDGVTSLAVLAGAI